jgi:hypothetical protein
MFEVGRRDWGTRKSQNLCPTDDRNHRFGSGMELLFCLPKKVFMKTREYIKAEENFKIDQEKRYQRKDKRLQVEQLTLHKEVKKLKGASGKK